MKPSKYNLSLAEFDLGKQDHASFSSSIEQSIRYALSAGWHFAKSHAEHPHGTWLPFVEDQQQNHGGPSERTIRRYVAFTGMSIVRLARKRPELLARNGESIAALGTDKTWKIAPAAIPTQEALYAAACEEALQSPVEFVALCREVGLMRSFTDTPGRARSEAARGRDGGDTQLTLDFAWTTKQLTTLGTLPDWPEDRRPETPQLLDLKAKLETALGAVNQLLGSVTIDHT
jgi:hypothetical protein